jgi:hypothetical protein
LNQPFRLTLRPVFKSIGIKGASSSLLASGIYGIVKIIATGVFIAFGIERFGRKKSLALGLGEFAARRDQFGRRKADRAIRPHEHVPVDHWCHLPHPP